MAITGTATFLAPLTGLASGDKTVKTSWSITAGVAQLTLVSLSSGDNTVTVPSGTTLVVIVPPTDNTQALKLKGAGGDTGVQISTTKPAVLSWQTGSSFILNAAGTVTGVEINFL